MIHLTRREREVVALVGQCRSYQQVARMLGISVRTVHDHAYSVHEKLDTTDRPKPALVRFYWRHKSQVDDLGSVAPIREPEPAPEPTTADPTP